MKKIFKRALIALLAMVMIFSVIACSSNEQDPTGTPTATTQTGETAQQTTQSSTSETPAPTSNTPAPTTAASDPTSETPVTPEKLIVVKQVSQNDNYKLFLSNKSEKTNKNTEFFDREKSLLVGDDNPWSVKPAASFSELDPNDVTKPEQPTVVDTWSYHVTVYLKGEDGSYAEASKEYIDAVDATNATIDFSDKACGHAFKVEVYPDGLTPKQQEKIDTFTVTMECEVIDGYNAYSAAELAYIDNRDGETWKNFKTAHGLDTAYAPAAVILQKDVMISKGDLPESFFYSKSDLSESDADYDRTLGSLKDYERLYERTVPANGTFGVYGNYFTLSIAELPVVTRENGKITPEGEVISHTSMIYFTGDGATSKATIDTVNFIGNAPRIEDTVKAGGIILNKSQKIEMTANNNIAICWFITYMPERALATYSIDNCKCYNNFNSFIYNWGCPKVKVTNSEFVGAGGPVLIQDHVDSTAANGGDAPDTAFENCVLSSHVVGTEGWFTVVKASAMVPTIKALDGLFTPFGRSFLKSNSDKSLTYLNLISVTKSGSSQTVTAEKIKGSLTINNHAFDYGASGNLVLAALLEQTFSLGAPTFETNTANGAAGVAYGTMEGLFDVTQKQIIDPNNAIYSGDYLSIYYNGMMFTFGYGPAGQIYTA